MLKRIITIVKRVFHLAYFKRMVFYSLSTIMVVLSGRRKQSRDYIRSKKNIYFGQRCFVVGNGPSLKSEDLDRIKNEVTFAANSIFKIFSQTDWRPTFWAIADETVANRVGFVEEASNIPCEMRFYNEQGFLKYWDIQGDGCFLHARWSRKYLKNCRFEMEKLDKGFYSIASVSYFMLQLAAYMGFTKIYLIGMDNKYSLERKQDGSIIQNDGAKTYFDGLNAIEKHEKATTVGASWETDIAFQYAEEYSRSHGFRIFNATRGGYLEVFERVNLDSILDE